MKKHLFILFIFSSFQTFSQALYFPPLTGNTWQSTLPTSLGWDMAARDSLLQFLEAKNSKAFIILKDGKIVMENYFNGFGADSLWYWASAGKTITSLLIGRAQKEGLLSIQDSTSKYLGVGWTSATPQQEGKIRIFHNLSMTTGLKYNTVDDNCTQDTCLKYETDAGQKWYYYNAPYLLLQDVVSSASGISLQQYTNSRLLSKTGMRGFWLNGVFYSRARDMARFGLMMLNKGNWNTTEVLGDTAYFRQATQTSQNLNLSYGYLWWLNGKASHKLPATNLTFPGSMVPSGPADMVMALGKNDQKIYVVPSQNLVVIRMGESAGLIQLALSSFDNELWTRISAMMGTTSTKPLHSNTSPILWKTKEREIEVHVEGTPLEIEAYSLMGHFLGKGEGKFQFSNPGIFVMVARKGNKLLERRLVKIW
jgi:CubicO group peptidase (beta-lactamase class C family)